MRIRITENATGEFVEVKSDIEPQELARFMWEDGNYSCDCNREIFFRTAKGECPDLNSCTCGEDRFAAEIIE